MLWLALHCPTLPLDCVLRRWPAGTEPALAVTDLDRTRRFVAVTSRPAQAAGVRPGQTIATALALLPDLILIPRDAAQERRALVDVALAALRFTPTVSLRASGLVMEISASLRLFGGRRALKRRLRAATDAQGLAIVTAEAPTPHGAWLLACEVARRRRAREDVRYPHVDAALDALPIGHLDTARPFLDRLVGIGCRTLADLERLPVKGLARRFGPGLVDEIERARGRRPDPQALFEVPDRFDARVELMARVETADALNFVGQRLLVQLAGWLAARRCAVRGFTLILHHDCWTRDAIEPTEIPVALATPSHDPDRLVALMRERLGRVELRAPVLELSLAAPAIVEATELAGPLFPERRTATETLARLIEKLAARLGPEAMTRIERVADHRPELAWREILAGVRDAIEAPVRAKGAGPVDARIVSSPASPLGAPIDGTLRSTPNPPGLPPTLGPRPAWLMPQPEVLEVRQDQPLHESLPLDRLAGPERIETGWWDDRPATRDYYIAENAAGRLVWIYRERLPVDGRDLWYLQGIFG